MDFWVDSSACGRGNDGGGGTCNDPIASATVVRHPRSWGLHYLMDPRPRHTGRPFSPLRKATVNFLSPFQLALGARHTVNVHGFRIGGSGG